MASFIWPPKGGGGGGTVGVTSVGLSVPSWLTVTGSPVTASGVFVVDFPGTSPITPDAASGTNTAGTALTLAGGQGTGDAAGGDLLFQVSLPGTSGSSPNAFTTVGKFKANPAYGGTFENTSGTLVIGDFAGGGSNLISTQVSLQIGATYPGPFDIHYTPIFISNNVPDSIGSSNVCNYNSNTTNVANAYSTMGVGMSESYFCELVYWNNQTTADYFNGLPLNGMGVLQSNAPQGLTLFAQEGPLYLFSGNGASWQVTYPTGHFMPLANNTWDIGTSSNNVRDFYVGGAVFNQAAQTTLTGSAGTAKCNQPEQGTTYKKVAIYLAGYTDTGTQTYTFPTAFSHTPYIYGLTAGVTGATVSATTITFTCTTLTGFVFLEGY